MHTHLRGSQILEKSLKHSSNPKVRPGVYLAPGNVAGSKGWLKSFPQHWTETQKKIQSGATGDAKPCKMPRWESWECSIFSLNLNSSLYLLAANFQPHWICNSCWLQKTKINQHFAEPFNKHLNFEELGFAFPSSGFSRWKCYRFRQASKGQYSKTTRQRDLLSESMGRWEWPMGRVEGFINFEKNEKKTPTFQFTGWLKKGSFLSL